MVGNLADVITYARFQDGIFRGTISQVVEFPGFLSIFAWSLQECSAACDYNTYKLLYNMATTDITIDRVELSDVTAL